MVSGQVQTKKVFLGGTAGDSKWRDRLIPSLTVDAFNPVVADWTPADQEREDEYKANADIVLYYFTGRTPGLYSAFEVGVDAAKRPNQTVFFFDNDDEGVAFENHAAKAMKKMGQDCEKLGATWCKTREELIAFLNK